MKLNLQDTEAMKALSEQINTEGAVLLRNNKFLPFAEGEKIAVFGRVQKNYYKSGTGSGGMVRTAYVTNIYDSLRDSGIVQIDEELSAVYDRWIEENPFNAGNGWTQPWAQEEMPLDDDTVMASAKRADKALIIIGRTAGEDKDNTATKGSYLLTDNEYNMISKVSYYFDKVAVILNTGNILDMKWAQDFPSTAIMYVWQGGQDGGQAVADILLGKRYPSGKLSDTIAVNIEDYPAFENYSNTQENIYTEDVFVGYRYFETFARDKVLYPFGFGLSYTDFKVEFITAQESDGKILVEAQVRNIGRSKGKEVIQLYFEGLGERLSRPSRELVAFVKTRELGLDETETVSISFDINEMAAYDDTGITGNKSCYVLEKGKYNVYAGTDVRSAVKVFTHEQTKTIVTKRLEERLAPETRFDRIVNDDGNVGYETVGFKKKRQEYPTAAKEFIYDGDKGIKLEDVYARRSELDDFISQLSDFDLACISQGEGMNSNKVRPGTGGTFGGVTKSLQDFGIPAVCVTDGPSGLRFDNDDIATSLPNGTLLACTWNDTLVKELYTFEGKEASVNRVDGLLGPGINIHRLPLCGRNFEYLSEDPYLTGKIATGICKGLKIGGITGTVKHFFANNKETNRKEINVIISERAIREIYLKPFEMVIKSRAVNMVMTAYNRVNGTFCSASYELNTGILRDEWGFDGVVMTDWWPKTCYDSEGKISEAREYPIKAQNDVFMVNADSEKTAENIMPNIVNGRLNRAELARNAANILRVIMTTQTFRRFVEGDVIGVHSVKDISELSVIVNAEDVKPKQELVFRVEAATEMVIKLKYSSECSELMQIPVKIYIDNNNAGVYMIRGTGGKTEETLNSVYVIKGAHKLHFEFVEGVVDIIQAEVYE